MKIIFLDIDGVLNVIPQGHDHFGAIFHKHLVDNLAYIIENTGAKIVISSTWRFSGLQIMQEMWSQRELPGEVIGITPFLRNEKDATESVERGYEINDWITTNVLRKLNNELFSYVIIDDDNDMLTEQQENFVRTFGNHKHPDKVDYGYGLTRICAEKAIHILNNRKKLITS